MRWWELLVIAVPPTIGLVGVGLKVGGEIVVRVIEWLATVRAENTTQHAEGQERLDRLERGIGTVQTEIAATRNDVHKIDEKLDEARERLAHVEGRLDK